MRISNWLKNKVGTAAAEKMQIRDVSVRIITRRRVGRRASGAAKIAWIREAVQGKYMNSIIVVRPAMEPLPDTVKLPHASAYEEEW